MGKVYVSLPVQSREVLARYSSTSFRLSEVTTPKNTKKILIANATVTKANKE